MSDELCPVLINAAAEGIACGDFAIDQLKKGDQVKLLCPIALNASWPENRIALWVRVTEIHRHPLPDHELFTGVIDEVREFGNTGLLQGKTIRFARCNIVEIA